MKRCILSSIFCGTIILLTPCAFAQGTTTSSTATPACPPGKCEGMWFHHRQHELEFLTKALGLSNNQQSNIKTILEQRYTQLRGLHENTSMSAEQRKEEAKKIFRESHEKLMAVLTPDQKGKMHQIRKHHMEKEESASRCSDPNCSSSVCPTASTMPMPTQ